MRNLRCNKLQVLFMHTNSQSCTGFNASTSHSHGSRYVSEIILSFKALVTNWLQFLLPLLR